mgnify:CR=1 FL=1
MSIEDRLVGIANALEELTKAIETGRVQIKDIQDHITTIEECDISEWNTPTKNYLLEGGATHSWRTGAKIVKE